MRRHCLPVGAFQLSAHARYGMAVPSPLIGATVLLIVLLVSTPGASSSLSGAAHPPLNAQGLSPSGSVQAAGSLPNITDGQTIQITGPTASSLTDTLTYGSTTNGTRSYTIRLEASVALPNQLVTLDTLPLAAWGLPQQLAGGVDNLPPLSFWNWTILHDGQTDTTQWKEISYLSMLSVQTSWANQTYRLTGTTSPVVSVQVNTAKWDGTLAPSVGFVVNMPGTAGGIPPNDPGFAGLAAGLHPQIVRFDADTAGICYSWDVATNEPRFNFTYFDTLYAFAKHAGAKVLFSLPAGNWGDGNLLPGGMPLNTSLLVVAPGGSGYFPANGAWIKYVEGIVSHTIAAHENITYWTIGNEVPVTNQTVVDGYVNLFNLAQRTIHSLLPSALVGSDRMTTTSEEPYFAHHAHDVGFLSFHNYPAIGLCFNNGTYCPPAGNPNGTTDPALFAHSAFALNGQRNAPAVAQSLWFNITGHELPVIDAETNLNGAGGSPTQFASGTDPRQQSLFGAAWVTSELVDGAAQNVSSFLYFSLATPSPMPPTATSPYGGWGFGLTMPTSTGGNTRFAPYYALELWSTSILPQHHGFLTNVSSPNMVYAYAAKNGTGFSVFLINRVNVPVSINLALTGKNLIIGRLATLDANTYREVYNPANQTTELEMAEVNTTHPANSRNIEINGYGVVVAHFFPKSGNAVLAGTVRSGSPVAGSGGVSASPSANLRISNFPDSGANAISSRLLDASSWLTGTADAGYRGFLANSLNLARLDTYSPLGGGVSLPGTILVAAAWLSTKGLAASRVSDP
jgi:hypothetical protein